MINAWCPLLLERSYISGTKGAFSVDTCLHSRFGTDNKRILRARAKLCFQENGAGDLAEGCLPASPDWGEQAYVVLLLMAAS